MKNNLQKIFVIVWGLCLTVMSVSGHSEQKCIHENVRTVPYPQEKTPLYINPSALFVPYSLKGEDKLQFALSSDESFPVHSTFFLLLNLGVCIIRTVHFHRVYGSGNIVG